MVIALLVSLLDLYVFMLKSLATIVAALVVINKHNMVLIERGH